MQKKKTSIFPIFFKTNFSLDFTRASCLDFCPSGEFIAGIDLTGNCALSEVNTNLCRFNLRVSKKDMDDCEGFSFPWFHI